MATHYVVYYCEHLRDGREEGAKVFSDKAAALDLINRMASGFCGSNMTFRLFELGKEIPIETEEVSEPQPPKTKTRYKIQ